MKPINTILIKLCIYVFIINLSYAQVSVGEEYLQKLGSIDSLYSNTLNEYREIYIQLPPSYNPKSNQKYPVIYVLDGEVFLPTVANVHQFYSGGFMPEMIIVGISNSRNRMRDLTTSKVSEMYGMPFNQENGGAANFITFIEAELIPYVENKYLATNYRTLIGHSYAGLFAIYSLVHHPHLFSNYIAIDPSLNWDNQKLIQEAKDKLSSKSLTNKSVFMSLGGQLHMQNPNITLENIMEDTSDFTGFARSNITFSKMLQEVKSSMLTFKWEFYPKDLHGTIALPSIMDGLLFNFEWFQMEQMHKFNTPETPTEELLAIANKRADKLKAHFGYTVPPYPEELLNVSGYMNLDMNQIAKSKMFFDLAIKYYPESANTYDSMADFFERTKNYSNALEYATKAYKISRSPYHEKRIKDLQELIKK